MIESKFQIGKNGITDGVIKSLNQDLKTHNQIRVSILKSAERNREKILLIAEEIIKKVDYHCNYRIIGFTILIRKQSTHVKR